MLLHFYLAVMALVDLITFDWCLVIVPNCIMKAMTQMKHKQLNAPKIHLNLGAIIIGESLNCYMQVCEPVKYRLLRIVERTYQTKLFQQSLKFKSKENEYTITCTCLRVLLKKFLNAHVLKELTIELSQISKVTFKGVALANTSTMANLNVIGTNEVKKTRFQLQP